MNLSWQPVEPAYKTYLQLVVITDMVILALIGLIIYILPTEWQWLPQPLWVGIPWAVFTLAMTFIWPSRRLQFTAYARPDEAVFLRRGALWQTTRAVPINRIQHVEVRQGFIERTLGLAHLVLYTAGSSGADLSIPGLKLATAEQIKHELIQTITHQPIAQETHE